MASTETPTTIPTTHGTPVRRPYRGSCHCGYIQYIVFLALPPAAVGPDVKGDESVRMYKCNCATCHKMGLFHVRLQNDSDDFYLLLPLDGTGLTDYLCVDRVVHWFFCSTCGVRCFAYCGDGEVDEIDLEEKLSGKSEGKMTRVWRYTKPTEHYLSINGLTIEPDQEGFDLRHAVKEKWVLYDDMKDGLPPSADYPHRGGAW